MVSDDDLRDKLTGALSDHGVVPNVEAMHSWRCNEPDRFPDYCHCIPDLTDALMTVVREALAQARAGALDGVALELADCENDCAGLLAERANQWRQEQP